MATGKTAIYFTKVGGLSDKAARLKSASLAFVMHEQFFSLPKRVPKETE